MKREEEKKREEGRKREGKRGIFIVKKGIVNKERRRKKQRTIRGERDGNRRQNIKGEDKK
ncbi:MAG: hypothetical protein ACTSRR_03660 [Candidatus Heimdallarchaeaceae archaeon]